MLKFYGPGFKNLVNAAAAYMRFYCSNNPGAHVLAINPTNGRWYLVALPKDACPVCGWCQSSGIRDEGCFFPEYNCPRTSTRI